MNTGGVDFLEDLGRLALFVDLPTEELETVAASAEEVSFSEGEWIIRQGDPQSAVYVIVEGEVAVVIDDEDRRVLSKGSFFGEVAVLLEEPASASIITRTPAQLPGDPGLGGPGLPHLPPAGHLPDPQGRGAQAQDRIRVAHVTPTNATWRRGAAGLPPDRRARDHRRPAHGRAGRHRRHDRLVLLPALRLAERLRRDPRPQARRLLPDRPGRRRLDAEAALLPRHERPDHALPHPRGRGRGAGLHADPRGARQRVPPPADPARAGRARRADVPRRGRAALQLRARPALDRVPRERGGVPLRGDVAGARDVGAADAPRHGRRLRDHAGRRARA